MLLDAVARLADDGVAVECRSRRRPVRSATSSARQCVRLGIADRVRFLGGLTEPEVAERAATARTSSRSPAWSSPTATRTASPWRSWRRWPRVCRSWHPTRPGRARVRARRRDRAAGAAPDDAAALAAALRTRARSSPRRPIRRARAARALVEERFAVRARRHACCALRARIRASRVGSRVRRRSTTSAFAHGTRRGTWKFYDAGATHTTATTSSGGRRRARRERPRLRLRARRPGVRRSRGAARASRDRHLARRDRAGARRRASGRASPERRRSPSWMPRRSTSRRASFDLVCGTSILHHLDVDRAYSRGRARPAAVRPRDLPRAARPQPRCSTPTAASRRPRGRRTSTRSAWPTSRRPARTSAALRWSTSACSRRGRGAHGRARSTGSRAPCGGSTSGSSRCVPPLRSWSWMVVIVLSRPVARAEPGRAPAASGPRTSAAR